MPIAEAVDMGWFGKKSTAGGVDALLLKLRSLKKNILNEELRTSFLTELKDFSENKVLELQGGSADDPHFILYQILLTAVKGMRPDEFTTQKVEALDRALVVVGASRIPQPELERCQQQMLASGLLGYGFSGGNRRTVDGKY